MTGPVINLMRTTVLLFHPKQIFHPVFPPQWGEILSEGGLLFDATVFSHIFDSRTDHNELFGPPPLVEIGLYHYGCIGCRCDICT